MIVEDPDQECVFTWFGLVQCIILHVNYVNGCFGIVSTEQYLSLCPYNGLSLSESIISKFCLLNDVHARLVIMEICSCMYQIDNNFSQNI